jgi:hypothetical protein
MLDQALIDELKVFIEEAEEYCKKPIAVFEKDQPFPEGHRSYIIDSLVDNFRRDIEDPQPWLIDDEIEGMIARLKDYKHRSNGWKK